MKKIILLPLFFVINFTLYGIFYTTSFKEKIVQQHNFNNGILKINNDVGSISITGTDSDKIEINIIKKANKKESIKNINVDIDIKNNEAVINGNIKNNADGELKIKVKVPKNTKLEKIYSKVGAIKINNISSNIKAITATGSIDLSLPKQIDTEISCQTGVGSIYSNFNQIKVEKIFPYVSSQAHGVIGKKSNNKIILKCDVGSISIKSIAKLS